MTRILAGALMLFLGVLLPPWLLMPFFVLHALAWFGYELIIIGALIDAYFGGSTALPLYTIFATGVVVCIEFAKPYLSFYNAP